MKPTKMQVIKAQEGYNEVGQVVEVLYTTGIMSKCYNSDTGFHYLTRSENLQPVYMATFTLEPQFDSRKSFYGKAKVSIIGEKAILTSYNTEVAEIHFDHFNERNGDKVIVHGDYSPTTLRHIKEFLLQYGFKAESKAQILADYTQYKWMDLQDESDFHEGTLQDVKDWLIDFWNFNPDEEMSDKEHAKLVKDIQKCKTSTKLNDFLGGIDWYMEQI